MLSANSDVSEENICVSHRTGGTRHGNITNQKPPQTAPSERQGETGNSSLNLQTNALNNWYSKKPKGVNLNGGGDDKEPWNFKPLGIRTPST